MKITVSVPQSDSHPLVEIMARSEKWSQTTTLDDTHKNLDIELPKGVATDDVEVVARFCISNGTYDQRFNTMLLKEKIVKAKPEPKPAPKPMETAAPEVTK